ncbi:MAG: PQQ-dependent sugar dehydrogenase [Longimicrobiales bacterium]
MRNRAAPTCVVLLGLAASAACGSGGGSAAASQSASNPSADPIECAPDNGGITLPDGFCASVFADLEGAPRHLAVAPNGDVFVALRDRRDQPGGVVALRDADGDGVAEVRERWAEVGGTGIAWRDGWLYFAPDDAVLRYRVPTGSLRPAGPPDTIVSGLPDVQSHRAKTIVLVDGALFVGIGSPTNSCQVDDRQRESPGRDPCPDLAMRAGIWRFDPDRPGQMQADGERFATGIRNPVAMAAHPRSGQLYAVQHGRDQLFQNWPDLYTEQESAEKPAEEFLRVDQGDDFGWPYCYFDRELDRKVLAPEYGGDGTEVGRCGGKEDPILAFPGHWAPNGLSFYDGSSFPERYRSGALIAFHGSWNRAPLPQQGYKVVFVPMRDGAIAGNYETFADGFAGDVVQPGEADHRPTGVAVGPDGSLFITDDAAGRIWKVVYTGG